MKKLLTLMLLSFFLLTLVSVNVIAQPVTQVNVNANVGLQIFYPEFETVPQNATFNLHVHVSNKSDGLPLANTAASCFLHLYDNTGNHTFESVAMGKDSNGWDHEVEISEGNFTKLGSHAFTIWCNTTDFGGEVKGTFEVTPSGKANATGITQIVFFLLFLVLIFSMIFSFLRVLGFWKDLSVDILDWAGSISIYMVLFAFYYLTRTYLGDPVIDDLLLIMLQVGAVTHVFAATAAFVTSLIFNPLRVKK